MQLSRSSRTLFLGFLVLAMLKTNVGAAASWREVRPGGDTACARGGDYAFWVSDGDPKKVVVDFIGGGACWDAKTCAPGSRTFLDNVDWIRGDLAILARGIYDTGRADNPFAGWTHITVPYCTGDIHWGERDVEYSGYWGPFTVKHRGAVNTRAVLKWMTETFPEASDVSVAGCSAGAYGSIFWTPQIRQIYPHARMTQFADSGAGVVTPGFINAAMRQWNVTAAAPAWIPDLNPETTDYNSLSIEDLYLRIAAYHPDVQFAQFNHDSDWVQSLFYFGMGGNPMAWPWQAIRSQHAIRKAVPNFRYFVASGETHCATSETSFYNEETAGVKLRDWLAAHVNGEAVGDVACETCAMLGRLTNLTRPKWATYDKLLPEALPTP